MVDYMCQTSLGNLSTLQLSILASAVLQYKALAEGADRNTMEAQIISFNDFTGR